MQIFVRDLRQQTFTVKVDGSDTVDDLKLKIEEKIGTPPDQQRLILAGRQLEDNQTLTSYRIQRHCMIHVIVRLRGMISTFTANDTSDPLVQYLMLSDEQRISAPVPLEALQQKFVSEGAFRFETFSFACDRHVISKESCAVLSSFLNFMWDKTRSDFPTERVDMRMRVPDDEFKKLLGVVCEPPAAEVVWRDLKRIFSEIPGTPKPFGQSKIVLRTTRGPSNACINFHCDGPYATGTVQIALNNQSEYSGGRLCFFVNNQLFDLDRAAGSVCQHPRGVLHAVTALTEGTRNSLFVIDEANGQGDHGIVDATDTDVQAFLDANAEEEARFPRLLRCCVCFTRFSNAVLLPCGHVCLCSHCMHSISTCPLCNSAVQNKHRIFV
eukprot:TRINITY_DN67124_c0_g1_i1.p1 TRINITY_DN67124_c0_g1~~TRINITY_DN67124_c0_g1_i1.p1  ORF type:complete len:382 (-),score=52.30 TRINITY_DN67124_c0_g1_i1:34-1179(-)